jgi:hypothetical protein
MIQPGTHATPRMDLGQAFHEYMMEGVRFIADAIFPQRAVAKKAATLKVTKRKNLDVPNIKHANGSTYNRITLYMDDLSYECVNEGLEGPVTDEDRANFLTDFDAEVEVTQAIKIKMRLAREQAVASAIFNTTTWDTSTAALYTDNSSAPWDTAGSAVIKQIQTAREQVRKNCGIPANSMIISEAQMVNLLNNTEIKAKFPGATVITEAMMRAQMGAIFGIQNLLVGQAIYNSANEGQDFSGADIWSDDYAMVAVIGSEGTPLTEPQLGRTMVWNEYASEVEYVESYREEQTESDIIRVKRFIQHKVFDPYFAHLMKIDA